MPRLIVLILILSVATPVWSQQHPSDQGEADTLGLQVVYYPTEAEDTILVVELFLFNDEQTIGSMSSSYSWDNPRLRLDSAIWSPEAAASWDFIRLAYYKNDVDSSNQHGVFQCVAGRLFTSGMFPSDQRKSVIRYYFTWREQRIADEVCFSLDDDIAFSLVDANTGAAWPPIWPGAVCHQLSYIALLEIASETIATHVVDHTPSIGWALVEGSGVTQVGYHMQVGTDSDWAVVEAWDTGPVTSSEMNLVYGGGPLLDGTTYYLRLRINDGQSWLGWEETSYRMNSDASVPEVWNPVNGAVTGQQPVFSVINSTDPEGDPIQYEFEVYAEPELVTLVASSGLVDEQPDITEWPVSAILIEDQPYFWRARSWDGYEYSDWHSPWLIWVDATPEAPGKPAVVAPLGEELILFDMLPAFEWTAVTDPDPTDEVSYRLDIATDEDFTFVNSMPGLTSVTHHLSDSLDFGEEYWWRVAATDNLEHESVSDPAHFWTWMLGDVTHNHDVSIGDISLLVDHLFINKTPIVPLKVGDVNATCDITIGDISRLVDHLFKTQAPLQVGCE